jgi:hypothetical protein
MAVFSLSVARDEVRLEEEFELLMPWGVPLVRISDTSPMTIGCPVRRYLRRNLHRRDTRLEVLYAAAAGIGHSRVDSDSVVLDDNGEKRRPVIDGDRDCRCSCVLICIRDGLEAYAADLPINHGMTGGNPRGSRARRVPSNRDPATRFGTLHSNLVRRKIRPANGPAVRPSNTHNRHFLYSSKVLRSFLMEIRLP